MIERQMCWTSANNKSLGNFPPRPISTTNGHPKPLEHHQEAVEWDFIWKYKKLLEKTELIKFTINHERTFF